MKIRLDEEIARLKRTLEEMNQKVIQAISHSIEALRESNSVLAKQVIQNDVYINRLEVEVDKISLKIFALKQPIAFDLRFVVSCLKVNNDLERAGDFASRIAEDTLTILGRTLPCKLDGLYQLASHAERNLKDSMDSFIHGDVDLARKMIEADELVDEEYKKVIDEIADCVHDNSEQFEMGLSLINMSKSLERIGDHATNIAEQSIYLQEGKIVKHPQSMKGQ